jgi:hypothetical protein
MIPALRYLNALIISRLLLLLLLWLLDTASRLHDKHVLKARLLNDIAAAVAAPNRHTGSRRLRELASSQNGRRYILHHKFYSFIPSTFLMSIVISRKYYAEAESDLIRVIMLKLALL